MARPTLNPRKDLIASDSLLTTARRRVTVTTLNTSNTGAFNRMVLFAPASGRVQINSVRLRPNILTYVIGGEADTWIFNVKNTSTAATLNSAAASLSNQVVAATGFKELLVDNGNSTLEANAGLQLQLTVSGAPQTLLNASVEVEWTPLD